MRRGFIERISKRMPFSFLGRLGLFILCSLGLYSCTGNITGAASLPLAVLYQSPNCMGLPREPSVGIYTPKQWQTFLRQQGPRSKSVTATPSGTIIIINMGERSTGGYGLSTDANSVNVINGLLSLPVIWRTPATGKMQIQMLSHPCLAVSVAAEVKQVKVIDQDGKQRLSSAGTP